MSPARKVMARCLAYTGTPVVVIMFGVFRDYSFGELVFGICCFTGVVGLLMYAAPAVVPERSLRRARAAPAGTAAGAARQESELSGGG